MFTRSDEDKLKWAFRLYDMDNNGVIDMDEMAAIIETLDCIEGVKPGSTIQVIKTWLNFYGIAEIFWKQRKILQHSRLN